MSEPIDPINPVILSLRPAELEINAHKIGLFLANEAVDKQAAMLGWRVDAVVKWGPLQSWPQQCRFIAECMTSEECFAVRHMLESLVEHLEAIPQERRSKEVAKQYCDMVAGLIADPFPLTPSDRKENEHAE